MSNVNKSGCEPCEKGKYKGSGDTTCKQCTSGEYTDQTGATECKQCEPVGCMITSKFNTNLIQKYNKIPDFLTY